MAGGGFVYFLLPGLDAPPPAGAVAMTVAGAAWGVYSLRGRASSDPLASTARSFALTAPVVAVVNLLLIGRAHWSFQGALLAAVSGTIASALGYVVWYAAVRRLPAISAATVQLTIPVIATLGGVLLLAEDLSVRLALGSAAILGGIALLISRRQADAD
jgi:drug/metabolite transporter (DMT)-like permease